MAVERPRIGIATSLVDGEQRLDRRYVLAVERAGGLPVIVPMCQSESALSEIVEGLQGLVVPGGPAVVEGLVGEVPEDLSATDPVRTASDRMLLEKAMRDHKPILGICYGMQLINALAGGSIYGDVQAQLDGALPHSEKRGGQEHPIMLRPGSVLSELMESGTRVNTRHIQAVAGVGTRLTATAHAPDGVVEAIESDDGLLVGVQFHPERMGIKGMPLFDYLVRRAGAAQ